jgi:RHS repeat-associated protein
MRSGRMAVGHPVDVASGAVYSTHEDISIPGRVALVWQRRYTTGLMEPTSLGPGWTTRYFVTLTQCDSEFHFFTPEGGLEIFADPEGVIELGGTIRNFGTFQELIKRDGRYIVTRWDVETGEVERYIFRGERRGETWPLESIEDVTGQGLEMLRDQQLRLTGIRQRLEKRTLIVGYTSVGQIQSVSFLLPDGHLQTLARYEYDSKRRLSAAYDALGYADRYEYDTNSRMTREIVKDGGVFYFRYDQQGRCIKTSGLDRYDEKTLRYFDFGWTEVTNSLGHVARYQWLPSRQMVSEINPLGAKLQTEYDEHGRIISKTDATGAVTRYTYDQFGNRATITDALGNTNTFTYNDQHLPVSLTDPLGHVWRRVYDDANRLLATTDLLGHRWQIRYDAEGNMAEIQNPVGARKRQQYTQGIVNAVTDWLGNETRFHLDPFGRVTERTGPLGEITRISYDQQGNPIEVILPDGSTLHATYDSNGSLTSFVDGNGYVTRFRYGPCQRLLERIDPVGGIVRYVWGSEPGQLEQIINEKGETYRFFRDEAGRIVHEQSFDGAKRSFSYDAEGYVVAYVNANDETVSIKRDPLHRVIGQTLPDGGQVTYSFDLIGNLISAVNADIAVVFERDPLGRIVREVQGEHGVESSYDALGNLIRTATSFGHTVEYEVDANGFVSKLTPLGDQTLTFKYNAYGQETSRQMPGVVVMEQRYDDLGRLIEQRVGPGRRGNSNTIISPQYEIIRRAYTYDCNGSLTSIVDGNWGRVDYAYDPAERLLWAIREQGPSESFSYDLAGNLARIQARDKEFTDETLVYGPGNRLRQKGSTCYEYDAEGRRVKKIEAVDSNNPKVWQYEWDALDQLRAVTRPNGEIWRYRYDALGRRVEKVGPNKRQQFLWDKDVIIHEFNGTRSLSAWMFDAYSFAPLATIQNTQVYSIINDHLGTPKELIDSRGFIAWSITAKSWGKSIRKNGNDIRRVDCQIRFQGQWNDEETDFYYSRFRYYDCDIGAFISQDPIGLAGGLNEYFYVKNPIHWIDPLGFSGIHETSRAARRAAMRDQGIPTSQQPISQSRNTSGMEYQYEVPKPGGGTEIKSVQQQTLDRSHPGQGHWEAGSVKTDPITGEIRENDYGRPKLTNDKSKEDYKSDEKEGGC